MGCLNAKPEAPNALRVDHTHFELYRVVGRGAFGKVNAVKHRATGELMAMKRCYKDVVLREGSDLVVWQERTIMASIHSPFLINLLYSFQSPVELFLVMPFMSGGDLSYHLKQRRFDEAAVRFYLCEMILGLEELHQLGYVYRDLKPANVLMDAKGHIRISDFGLAKRLTKEKSYLHTGYAGTRGYMAPEMVSGGKYTFGADFFSLGAVAFELLTGRRPFDDDSDTLEKDLSRDDLPSRTSDEAAGLVLALLTKNPMERIGFSRRPGGGWSRVKAHPFFKSVDWDAVARRAVPPPFVPPAGIANCSAEFEAEDQLLNGHLEAASRKANLTADDQDVFANFSFNTGLFDDNAADLAHKRVRSGTVSRAVRHNGGGAAAAGAAAAAADPGAAHLVRNSSSRAALIEEEKSDRSSRPGSARPEAVGRYRSAAPGHSPPPAGSPSTGHGRRRSISEYIKEKFGRSPARSHDDDDGMPPPPPPPLSRGVSAENATPSRHHRKNSAVDELVRRQMGVFDDEAETSGPVLDDAMVDRKSIDLTAA